jgi:hypothetical protein
MDNELGELFSRFMAMKKYEENSEYVDIAPLTESEADEWRSMQASRDYQFKQAERLKQEKKVLDARLEIFWYKLRTNYKAIDINRLKIDRHPGETPYYLQKGICKNGKLKSDGEGPDDTCDGKCDECEFNK